MYASILSIASLRRLSICHFFAVRLVAYVYLPCSAGTTTISTKVQSCLTRGLLSRRIRIDFPTCREGESRSLLSNCGLQPRYELALIGQDMLWITKGWVRIQAMRIMMLTASFGKCLCCPGGKTCCTGGQICHLLVFRGGVVSLNGRCSFSSDSIFSHSFHSLRSFQKPRKGNPVCHDETMKVLNALPAARYEVPPIYKYVQEFDKCMERVKEERSKGKASTLYHLSKYLVQTKNKQK